MARKIIQNAVDNGQGIGVFELTERKLPVMLMMLIVPIFVLLFTPFIKPFRISRILFTYLIPIIPLLVSFDGFVSCLRTYTEEELKLMVSEIENSESFIWNIGQESMAGNPANITYLIGHPKQT